MVRYLIFLAFLASLNLTSAQDNCDSLLSTWHDKSQPDTSRLEAAKRTVSECFLYTNPDSAKILGYEFLELAEELESSEFTIQAVNLLGIAHYQLSEFVSARLLWERGLKEEALDSTYRMAFLVNIGNAAKLLGNPQEAIGLYTEALIICDLLKDSVRRPILMMNIGTMYDAIGEFDKAREMYLDAYEFDQNSPGLLSNEYKMALLMNLLTNALQSNNLELAQEYSQEMFSIAYNTDNNYYMLSALDGRSKLLMKSEKWEAALVTQDSCLYYSDLMKEVRKKVLIYSAMSSAYQSLGRPKKALDAALKGYNLAKEGENLYSKLEMAYVLYEAYKNNGKLKEALQFHEEYLELKDSLSIEENKEELIHQEYRYEYEKAAIRDSIEAQEAMKIQQLELTAEKARNEQFEIEEEKQRQQIYFLILGLLLAIVFVGFIYNRLKLTKKQKKIISKQKDIVEFHRGRILESINYSKKIQNALLSDFSGFKSNFQDGFMIFEPKDIVSGDLYYLKNLANTKVIGCLDCTGHGVPGGFLSTLSGLVTDRVVSDKWDSPNQILKNLSDQIIKLLKQENVDAIQDGMDAAFCVLNNDHSELMFAGARLDVLIYRDAKFTRYEGDLLPVGGHYVKKGKPILREFTTQSVKLQPGDWIILQTDGLFEQPGGKENFPMKDPALFDLMERIVKSEERQKTFQSDLKAWIGKHERTDDICIFGFKV